MTYFFYSSCHWHLPSLYSTCRSEDEIDDAMVRSILNSVLTHILLPIHVSGIKATAFCGPGPHE